MTIQTAEIVHVYPTEVWYEKDFFGSVHVKIQHMAPDTKPFTFITINYDYAYTSNSHQHQMVQEIGKLLGQENIEQRQWTMPAEWIKDTKEAQADIDAGQCYCYNCNKDRLVNGVPFVMTRMIVCPNCGNKRCPHATDHNLECTKSNEPGQAGSRY